MLALGRILHGGIAALLIYGTSVAGWTQPEAGAAPDHQAAVPRDGDGSWFEMKRVQIVKILQRLRGAVGTLGDGLIDPRP